MRNWKKWIQVIGRKKSDLDLDDLSIHKWYTAWDTNWDDLFHEDPDYFYRTVKDIKRDARRAKRTAVRRSLRLCRARFQLKKRQALRALRKALDQRKRYHESP